MKEEDDNKVLSQETATHVIHIHSEKSNYLIPLTSQEKAPDNLKYDFSATIVKYYTYFTFFYKLRWLAY